MDLESKIRDSSKSDFYFYAASLKVRESRSILYSVGLFAFKLICDGLNGSFGAKSLFRRQNVLWKPEES